jgi:hypothetical protein
VVEGVLAIGFQGVDIEESVAFQIDRSENVVEEGNLCNVQVFGILVSQEHSEIKKDVADSGTGLVEGIGIGKEVGWTEPLDPMNRT